MGHCDFLAYCQSDHLKMQMGASIYRNKRLHIGIYLFPAFLIHGE